MKSWELVEALGHDTKRGHSPFAIVTGDRSEDQLKEGSSYQNLVDSLRAYASFPDSELQILNLNRVEGSPPERRFAALKGLLSMEQLRGGYSSGPSQPTLRRPSAELP